MKPFACGERGGGVLVTIPCLWSTGKTVMRRSVRGLRRVAEREPCDGSSPAYDGVRWLVARAQVGERRMLFAFCDPFVVCGRWGVSIFLAADGIGRG